MYLKICSENTYVLRHTYKLLIDCIHFSLVYFNLVMISIICFLLVRSARNFSGEAIYSKDIHSKRKSRRRAG